VLADPGPLLRGVYLPASSLLFCAATLTDVVTQKQLLMDRMICEQVGDMGHQLHLDSNNMYSSHVVRSVPRF
jgi:hypothetical protein